MLLAIMSFSIGEFTRHFGFGGPRADAIEDHIDEIEQIVENGSLFLPTFNPPALNPSMCAI